MLPASVPESDLARIRRWCADAVPLEMADQVRVELHRRGKSVTLCESRPPWNSAASEWDHLPMAQLRFRPEHHDWSLHWPDRNSRWHPYDHGNRQFGSIAELLAEIDDDPTAIFKG
jgi:DUF3024 family protein